MAAKKKREVLVSFAEALSSFSLALGFEISDVLSDVLSDVKRVVPLTS